MKKMKQAIHKVSGKNIPTMLIITAALNKEVSLIRFCRRASSAEIMGVCPSVVWYQQNVYFWWL